MEQTIKIGQKVIFDPLEDINIKSLGKRDPKKVIGTIVKINEKHRWFLVEYEFENKTNVRTAFKFDDINNAIEFVR